MAHSASYYVIELVAPNQRPVDLECFTERDDADLWAETYARGAAESGYVRPSYATCTGATRSGRSWRLGIDGQAPWWVKVREAFE